MPEKKRKFPMFGTDVDVTDVPASKAAESFNEYTLEDGSILKVKHVATNFLRIDNQFLPDGRPMYIVLSTPVVNVESSPLEKK
jgi:hypothetical protein